MSFSRRSREKTSQQHPELRDGNSRTPSQNDYHILQETSRNNEKVSDKIQYVPDDVGDKSLPQQGQQFIKRARTKEGASKAQFSLAPTSCLPCF